MYTYETFDKTAAYPVHFQYLCYKPKEYDGTKPFPLVVFLHGAGERGDCPDYIAYHGFMQEVAKGKDYPFLIVAPQCPQGKYWGNYLESLNLFLDDVLERYAVDRKRIYLTGLSMGGTGTWHWLMANPERFAAAAPVCGSGITWYACQICQKPIWIFHGDCDSVVPVQESLNMAEAIRRCGGEAKLTILKGVDHDAWNYAYNDELASWFLQHSLEE